MADNSETSIIRDLSYCGGELQDFIMHDVPASGSYLKIYGNGIDLSGVVKCNGSEHNIRQGGGAEFNVRQNWGHVKYEDNILDVSYTCGESIVNRILDLSCKGMSPVASVENTEISVGNSLTSVDNTEISVVNSLTSVENTEAPDEQTRIPKENDTDSSSDESEFDCEEDYKVIAEAGDSSSESYIKIEGNNKDVTGFVRCYGTEQDIKFSVYSEREHKQNGNWGNLKYKDKTLDVNYRCGDNKYKKNIKFNCAQDSEGSSSFWQGELGSCLIVLCISFVIACFFIAGYEFWNKIKRRKEGVVV